MDKPTTVKRAAEIVSKALDEKVTARTIYRWVEKGAVPRHQTPGGRLRVVPRECLPRPQGDGGRG